jgi:hypothetical protein
MSEGALHGLLVVVWAAGMVSLVAAALVQYAIYRRLRAVHVPAWETLGRPTVVRYNQYLTTMGRFIWKREYRELEDTLISQLALVIKILIGLVILGLASGAILAWVPLRRS